MFALLFLIYYVVEVVTLIVGCISLSDDIDVLK